MANKLNPDILATLSKKLGKEFKNIRPRLSEIIRGNAGLTLNAAAQIYAQKNGVSVLQKLDKEDKQTLATVQAITQVSVSNVSKVDKRTLNLNNSPVHNLSFGDRNKVSQNVVCLDDVLTELVEQIENSESLTEDEKNDYKSDIQTVATQVGKSKPNREIVSAAWEGIKGLATIGGFVQVIDRVAPLIKPFLG